MSNAGMSLLEEEEKKKKKNGMWSDIRM